MKHCTPINKCLACGSIDLVATLDLKDQPLANNFQKHAGIQKSDLWFPLAINRCEDCDHLQLTHAVDPEIIYKNYLYVSGTSPTYVKYMDWYARFVAEQCPGAISVFDIGCNDGSQLDAFKKLGFITYGIDPAENLYPISSARHETWQGFWNDETYTIIGQKFDVISSQNAFSHIPDPLSYLKNCANSLTHNGKIFISTSQADMVINGEFDTIYHEHISYYNARSMQALAERAGLYLIDVIKTPIHGISYIFILSKKNINPARVQNILKQETHLHRPSLYDKWANNVDSLLVKLVSEIDNYRNWGYTIVGYGAAAKGMTLINASNIILDCVIDDNPLKQGLYCPGTSIPVVGIDWLDQLTDKERVVFIPLAWNYYRDIVDKIRQVRKNKSDIFLKYFPNIAPESFADEN